MVADISDVTSLTSGEITRLVRDSPHVMRLKGGDHRGKGRIRLRRMRPLIELARHSDEEADLIDFGDDHELSDLSRDTLLYLAERRTDVPDPRETPPPSGPLRRCERCRGLSRDEICPYCGGER